MRLRIGGNKLTPAADHRVRCDGKAVKDLSAAVDRSVGRQSAAGYYLTAAVNHRMPNVRAGISILISAVNHGLGNCGAHADVLAAAVDLGILRAAARGDDLPTAADDGGVDIAAGSDILLSAAHNLGPQCRFAAVDDLGVARKYDKILCPVSRADRKGAPVTGPFDDSIEIRYGVSALKNAHIAGGTLGDDYAAVGIYSHSIRDAAFGYVEPGVGSNDAAGKRPCRLDVDDDPGKGDCIQHRAPGGDILGHTVVEHETAGDIVLQPEIRKFVLPGNQY